MATKYAATATVRNVLTTSTIVGSGFKVTGDGKFLDQALVVNAGAKINYGLKAPLIECVGDLDVAGTVTADFFSPVYTSSADVAGNIDTSLLLTARFSQDFYVSPDGHDIAGTGTATDPLKTISAAVSAAGALPNVNPVIIHVAPGTYTENINIPTCVSIISESGVREDVVINGNIALFIYRADPDINKNVVLLQSLTINGSINLASVGFPNIRYTFSMNDCYVKCPINGTGIPVFRQEVDFDGINSVDTYITNCTIENDDDAIESTSTSPMIVIVDGSFSLSDSDVTLRTGTSGAQSIIVELKVNPIKAYFYNNNFHVRIDTVDNLNFRTSIIRADFNPVNLFVKQCVFDIQITDFDIVPVNPSAAITVSYPVIPVYLENNTFNVVIVDNMYTIFSSGFETIYMIGNVYVPGSTSAINGLPPTVIPTF